jgi:TPR repeat protein
MCGNKLETQIKCPKCHKVLNSDFKFCPYCGSDPFISGDVIESENNNIDINKNDEETDENDNQEKIFIELKKKAEQGDSKAQFEIGEMYFKGYGEKSDKIKENVEEALKWYMKSAEQGYIDAQIKLGDMYHYGEGIDGDDEEAFKWYMKAAEQGDPDACYIVGTLYEMGDYVEENEYEAFEWYKKAVDAGCDYAEEELQKEYGITKYSSESEINEVRGNLLNELGNRYHYGTGVNIDYHKAVEYYRKASDLGNMYAQFNLALDYEQGTGVEKNYSIAVSLYNESAKQGLAVAQYNLGVMYEKGNGVSQNLEEAFKWYHKAAEQGSDRAQDKLAYLYYSGNGVTKNYDLAVYWCKQAAKQNYAHAQKNLGVMYEYGYGVPQNIEEAVEWFQKAVDNGNKEAIEDLKRAEVKLNKLNKGNHYPHLKLSELSRNIIGLAANNVFNDSLWQAFGFNKAPIRGSIFNHFITSEQLAKETFLSREFLISALGIFVRLLHKQTDFTDVEYIKYLSDSILDYKDVSHSLRFNDVYEAKRYFESYIKEYVQEDKNPDDIFLNHCRDNNIAKDSKVIVGSQLVCNSLSDFLEQKLQEIDKEYYIEDDITSYRFYKSNTGIKATSPQQTFKPNPEKTFKMDGIKGLFYIVRYHIRDSREIKQTIFYDKSQAEAHFNKKGDNDAFNYSRMELLECNEGNIKELAKKKFRVIYADD